MTYLTQPLHRALRQSPGRPFTVYGERTHTARETHDVVSRIAGALAGLGVRADDRVGLLSPNTDRFCQIVLGIAWADAVVVPLNTRWSAGENAYALDEADVTVLFVDDAFLPIVDRLRERAPVLRTIVHCGDEPTPDGLVPLAELLTAAPVEDAHRNGHAMAGIFYTGGTTGFPQGVVLGHRQLVMAAMGTLMAQTRVPHGGACVLVAPAFHLAGFGSWIAAMLTNATVVPLPAFDPVGVLRAVERHRAKQIMLVPTMIQLLVDHPDAGTFDVSSLELLTYGASPISEALLDRARTAFPAARFAQAYGMTELSPTTTILGDEDHDDPALRRSAGRAAPYARIRIVGETDQELPSGEVGEIVVAGDHVMAGYWKKPAETAAAIRNGWLHTGDAGYLDERGYLFVVDRLKDMIISGGENVYSTEVENVIAKHPAVSQVAVIGLPDDEWGERVHAVVTLLPGTTLTAAELREFCRQAIAGHKCPRSLEIVERLPMSAAGKILKRDLRNSRAVPAEKGQIQG
ncbi:long-chain-fatty-acid--CoA ligase [Amycolatopsis rifamycinica]|uniref:Fatty-acid--CoA ligase n=1 Tax=Amycolatopsis rifamycinica TaxID=287986 RepID=A0A066TMR9_9PSEU|nr:long-chain-fatty-acid--CoA ligase [Amycolatopsis rifamycinica]KDN16431.1 fatty-acid--CoA ligase [Amycolatopsis rifamycinica]